MTVARTVRRLRASNALRAAARLGLVSRGLFYLLLAYLTAALAAGPTVRGSQVTAKGPPGGLRHTAGSGRPGRSSGRVRDVRPDPAGRRASGHALVWVSGAGFVIFAASSLLEARYRTVHAGD